MFAQLRSAASWGRSPHKKGHILGTACMASRATNTIISHGIRDFIVQNSVCANASKVMGDVKTARDLAAAVVDRVDGALIKSKYRATTYEVSRIGDGVVCYYRSPFTLRIAFEVQDDYIEVYPSSHTHFGPEESLCMLIMFAMDSTHPLLLTSKGWQATGTCLLDGQTVTELSVRLAFKNRLSEIGLPMWTPVDTHPLTRHLVGVADNTAEVDPGISGDPHVFRRRMIEAFDGDVAPSPLEPEKALDFVSNSWLNCMVRRGQLSAYIDDKTKRPYLFSK